MGFLILASLTIRAVYSIKYALSMCWDLVSGLLFLYCLNVSHLNSIKLWVFLPIGFGLPFQFTIKEKVSLINSILFCLLFPVL